MAKKTGTRKVAKAFPKATRGYGNELAKIIKSSPATYSTVRLKAGKVSLPRVDVVKWASGNLENNKPDRYYVIKRIRKAYDSVGYKVATTTKDGVVIVEPASKPDSFQLKSLKQAISKAHQ